MGAQYAPQWLLSAFVRSVNALGASAPREEIERIGSALLERWSTPDRHHHDVSHLVSVLQAVDSMQEETHNPELVRVAAWYHGAVFDATMAPSSKRPIGEDKVASARLAHDQLTELGVSERLATRVHDLILKLQRHEADPADVDALALCDADLATLAVEPQKYKEYRRRVRAEFAHIDEDTYLLARRAIITRLLGRPRLFVSPLAAQWEEPARQNLGAELCRVDTCLAKLGVALPDSSCAGTDAPTAGGTKAQGARPATERPARFAREGSHARGDTHVIPAVPAPGAAGRPGTRGGLPHMAPAGRSAETASPDEDDSEVIGVPFEEQVARPRREDTSAASGMERTPATARVLPRRVSVVRPDQARPDASAPTGASPTRPARRTSTPDDGDDLSTTGLFRPL